MSHRNFRRVVCDPTVVTVVDAGGGRITLREATRGGGLPSLRLDNRLRFYLDQELRPGKAGDLDGRARGRPRSVDVSVTNQADCRKRRDVDEVVVELDH